MYFIDLLNRLVILIELGPCVDYVKSINDVWNTRNQTFPVSVLGLLT